MVKEELINFETKIGDAFNKGEIKAPIHLYHGNEDKIIEIFDAGIYSVLNYFELDVKVKVTPKVTLL